MIKILVKKQINTFYIKKIIIKKSYILKFDFIIFNKIKL